MESNEDVTAKIIARPNCFRCAEIKEVLQKDNVSVEVVLFHEGGAKLLADNNFLPISMPAVMIYKGGTLVHRWSGLSEFLEKWGG